MAGNHYDNFDNTVPPYKRENFNNNSQTVNTVYYDNTHTTTGETSTHYCPIYPRLNGETGWICPKCGRGIAPWKSYCDCNSNWTITCGPTISVSDLNSTTSATNPETVTIPTSGVYEYHGTPLEVHLKN